MPRSYPCGARVLVVAPHPDDDAIGCGGTLARLAANGARISVVYVTDGGASHIKSKRFPPARLRDIREAEARAALRHLGIRAAPQFLRAPDGALERLEPPQRSALVAALAARIDALRAKAVFAPWPRDPHPDHVATAALVAEAFAVCRSRPDLLYYRVWEPVKADASASPQPGEVRTYDVALTRGERARKRTAILAHRSQRGLVVDDDPDGFCIDERLLDTWVTPFERFYRPDVAQAGTSRT